MRAIGIIPARMNSSRFPGKPLAPLLGMPLVGHCYHRTRLAPGISETYVATCDMEIKEYIESVGGKAVMTSDSHNRASTRTAEALEIIEKQLGRTFDVVVMVQGDEPLALPATIAATLKHIGDKDVEIVNVMARIATEEAFLDRNNVKVVVDLKSNALYYSREPIPSPWKGFDHIPSYMQTGIITFKKDALSRFNNTTETPLEIVESIDMNRVLETGGSVRMVSVDDFMIGVDTREELLEAEKILKDDPIVSQYL